MKQQYIFLSTALLLAGSSMAQNISSPYSVLGIGDLEITDHGRYAASGSASVSRREVGYYNFSNPASLTVIPYKNINLDMSFRGRSSKYKMPGADTIIGPASDFIVKKVSLAYKMTPKSAFAIGLRPYSTVDYQYVSSSNLNDPNLDYLRYTQGTGGIYQTYFSYAHTLGKQFSAGITTSWLFGSLQNTTSFYSDAYALTIDKKETKFYNSAGITAGLQYYSSDKKKWQHSVGATVSLFSKLKGYSQIEYIEADTMLSRTKAEDISFAMPVSGSLGYSLANRNGLSFHVQGTYQQWPLQKIAYKNISIQDAVGFNAGMEYSNKVKINDYTVEKYYLALGLRYDQSYLATGSNRLVDYAITFGGGKNITPTMGINISMEAGKKGNSSLNQVRENYFQFSIGVTLKDIWYSSKKFGLYR
ncbi:hypothetical protein IQ13_3657 [Lacibacter cauensis]|uniref:Long-subunit fatty acid transport protein n=1 Tax=Lacibacter cauensis TaxID=510947 RepID=A0A562SEE6_9BACT|nr:hypothetical protein [Lacibacter cauensis]TWI79254.1 hypothetical protein IQ13_3657 [Lacibacter cauensis]